MTEHSVNEHKTEMAEPGMHSAPRKWSCTADDIHLQRGQMSVIKSMNCVYQYDPVMTVSSRKRLCMCPAGARWGVNSEEIELGQLI